MLHNYTIFEFGLVAAKRDSKPTTGITWINDVTFDYLKKCCLCDQSESRFLRLTSSKSVEVLQVQSYVGVIFTPDGSSIEVLPKIGRVTCIEKARHALLCMLKSLGEFRHLQIAEAKIQTQKMPLLDLFIGQFLASVNTLVKQGLRRDYIDQEDNLFYLKGRLNVAKQIQHNTVNKHKFWTDYDEFLLDRPCNRLIHSALKRITPFTKRIQHQRLQQELLAIFSQLPTSHNIQQDLIKINLDRSMRGYQLPLAWAKLILEGFSPLAMAGQFKAFSLLFPMEAVFESYVAVELKKYLTPNQRLITQARAHYLVSHKGHNYFQLRPDLLIEEKNENNKWQVIRVLDTKWKMIDTTQQVNVNKYGIQQADLYQMLAYGYKYLAGEGQLMLIYPKHAEFDTSLTEHFAYSSTLTINIIAFDIPDASAQHVSKLSETIKQIAP